MGWAWTGKEPAKWLAYAGWLLKEPLYWSPWSWCAAVWTPCKTLIRGQPWEDCQ